MLNFFGIYITLFTVAAKAKPRTYFFVQKVSGKNNVDPEQLDLEKENGFYSVQPLASCVY